ncbi:hypothetical protein [Vibrio sp. FYR_4]|uniref:hypothetical protein n=1 Tax=Vibrio sp. FYR_4 TaxID=3367172 RepID=UPI00370B6EC7
MTQELVEQVISLTDKTSQLLEIYTQEALTLKTNVAKTAENALSSQAAWDAIEVLESNAKQYESLALQHRNSAEALTQLATWEQFKTDCESALELATVEASNSGSFSEASEASAVASEESRVASRKIQLALSNLLTQVSALTDQAAASAAKALQVATSAVVFRGVWDASSGEFPTPLGEDVTDYFKISEPGTMTDGTNTLVVEAGDSIYWNSMDIVWFREKGVDAVTSVDGQTGKVLIDKYSREEVDNRLALLISKINTKQRDLNLLSELSVGSQVFGRSVYVFNGENTYVSIPDIDMIEGESITFVYLATSSEGTQAFLVNALDESLIYIEDGYLFTKYCSGSINGVTIQSGVTVAPSTGGAYQIEITLDSAQTFNTIGSTSLSLAMYDVEFLAASGQHLYKLDDGWDANPVIKDSYETTISSLTLNGSSNRIDIPALILSGEFSVEATINTDVVGYNNIVSNLGTTNWMEVSGDGYFKARVAGNDTRLTFGGSPLLADGVDHTVILTRHADNTFTLTVDGTEYADDDGLVEGGDFIIETLGAFGGAGDYFSGTLRDVKSKGSESRHYPINDGWSANPVIQDLISGQDGTLINGTVDSWTTTTVYRHGTTVNFSENGWVETSDSNCSSIKLFGGSSEFASIRKYVNTENAGMLEIDNGGKTINLIGEFRLNGEIFTGTNSKIVNLGDVTASIAIDSSLAGVHCARLTEDTAAIALTGDLGSSNIISLMLVLEQDDVGGRSVTFPSNVKFPNGLTPRLSFEPGQIDIINLVSFDEGVTYLGAMAAGQFAEV